MERELGLSSVAFSSLIRGHSEVGWFIWHLCSVQRAVGFREKLLSHMNCLFNLILAQIPLWATATRTLLKNRAPLCEHRGAQWSSLFGSVWDSANVLTIMGREGLVTRSQKHRSMREEVQKSDHIKTMRWKITSVKHWHLRKAVYYSTLRKIHSK